MEPHERKIYHITHIDHVASIVQNGLFCDALVDKRCEVEIGHQHIKSRRKKRSVPAGGAVSDYVPFYFAPRSPTLFTISSGAVETYQGDQA